MSDRDKKLLVYLGALVILALAYFFCARPFLDKIDALSNEKIQLQGELAAKREAYENKSFFEQGIAESNEKIQTIIDEFPEDNSDEKSIMFASVAEAEIPIWFTQVKFAEETKSMISSSEGEDGEVQSTSDAEAEAEQQAVDATEGEDTEGGSGRGDAEDGEERSEDGNVGLKDLMYRDTELGLNYETTYDGFKNLLAYVRDYKDRMVIKQIDVTYNEDTGLAVGSLVLSQYAVLGSGRVLPEVETKVEDLGTDNVFVNKNHGGSILDLLADMYSDFLKKITGDLPEETLDEFGTDYFLKVNAVTDNTNGKTLGRADDVSESSYITSSRNKSEKVTFTVSGEGGKYSVNYKIGKAEYTDTIERTGDGKLYLRIVSTSRAGDEDECKVTVHVINESDIPVVVNVEGDDQENPRVKIKEKVGDVTVNGAN